MTLKSQMLTDASSVFLNSDEFAENIQYQPYGGSVRNIRAIIVNEGKEPRGEDVSRTFEEVMEIFVSKDSTQGVGTVTAGYDIVWLPASVPGRTNRYYVSAIKSVDTGMWHLELKR